MVARTGRMYKGSINILLWTLLPLLVIAKSGQLCLSCINVKEGEDCMHHVTCNVDEVCFKQEYTTFNAEKLHDYGCSFPELCQRDKTGDLFGKRSNEHGHVTCQKCCNSTRLCNMDLVCQNPPAVSQQRCRACSNVTDPAHCNQTITCGKDEVCFVQKFMSATQHQSYDLGCKHKSLCLHDIANPFGRRKRNSFARHLQCERCCSNGDLCNQNMYCVRQNAKHINESCTRSSECGGTLQCLSSLCQCQSSEYWLKDRCHQKKHVNESCSSSLECSDANNLQCSNGICQCSDTTYWNGTTCLKKHTFDEVCYSNQECVDFLICNKRKCVCDKSKYRTDDDKCFPRKDMNATCNSYRECKPPLVCLGNTCTCVLSIKNDICTASNWPKECKDYQHVKFDSVYNIYPYGEHDPIPVYCKMEHQDKWTVIQRMINTETDFMYPWFDYKVGFGSATGDFWLGLDLIHNISTNGPHELSIYLEDIKGVRKYANYSTFWIDDEENEFQINVTGYSGNAGDSMDNIRWGKINGANFSTYDHGSDIYCAESKHGGWWFNGCGNAELNIRKPYWWTSGLNNIKRTGMMIRKRS